MWTNEKTLHLIDSLKAMPCLWDTSIPSNKNAFRKRECLGILALQFGVDALEIDKKIKVLKSQFRRERRKLEAQARGGDCFSKRSMWFGYEPLNFLLQGREGHSLEDEADSDSNFDDWSNNIYAEPGISSKVEKTEPSSPVPVSSSPSHFLQSEDSPSKAFTAPQNDNLQNNKRESIEDSGCRHSERVSSRLHESGFQFEDEFDAIGVAVAAKLRKINSRNETQRIYCENLINQALFKAQLNQLTGNSVISEHS